jgi:protein tyrosine phosphatase
MTITVGLKRGKPEKRKVTQLQCVAWTDMTAPTETSILLGEAHIWVFSALILL